MPPATTRASPPARQRLSEIEGPVDIDGFYPPGYFREKADPWFWAQRERLVDVLANGEAATAPLAGTLIFGQHEMLPEYRGRLLEYSADVGRYIMTRTERAPDTHLNRAFSALFSDGYPDQEIFSCLEFGVSFKAESLELQLVLPDHLLSIAAGLGKLQQDLVRKVGLGWYDVFQCVPRNPWRPQQAGSRPKANGKVRTIINASYPHSVLCDDLGAIVHSLNSQARVGYDAARGSDGARMARLVQRLRTTAGSPPPDSGDVVVVSSDESTRPAWKVGRVTVANASARPHHPFSVYGGRGSLYGNPLCMDCEEQRDACCDGFHALLHNHSLSPYAVASRLGLRCNPVQARVSASARHSLMWTHARRLAFGGSLQLVCHCSPRRCHLHSVAAVIEAAADRMVLAMRSVLRAPSRQHVVLHLFSGSDGLASEVAARGFHPVGVEKEAGLDLLDSGVYQWLLDLSDSEAVVFAVAGIPCGTHSRVRSRPGTLPGRRQARPLRDRSRGGAPFPWLEVWEREAVARSDTLTTRACAILRRIRRRGGGFVVENPPDYAVGEYAQPPVLGHSPLWVSPPIVDLARDTEARFENLDQCCFGSDFQKPTTLMFSPRLRCCDVLPTMRCWCTEPHRRVAAGFSADGASFESSAAAAYPRELNVFLADCAAEHAARLGFGVARPWPCSATLVADAEALSADEAAPKLPLETKVLISEYMEEDALLKHVALLMGSFVVVQSDDFQDWFYQLRLAAASEWMVGFVLLELEKLACEMPELRFYNEKVLGQGTVPGSNLGQRLCYLVLHMWDVVFAVLDRPHLERERRDIPALEAWCSAREARGLEVRLHARGGYTDDTRFRFVTPARGQRGSKAWCFVTKWFRVMMADASKRQLGLHDISLGVHFNTSLGVAAVPEEKRQRALASLDLLLVGALAVEAYRSLLGLLLHLAFLADMSPSATHGMFTPLMPGSALSHGPATPVAGRYLTVAIRERAAEWKLRLESQSGAPFTAAVRALRQLGARRLGRRTFWRSDACKEGTDHPGIAGVRGCEYWVRRLHGRECDIPIPVTEFVGHFGNVLAWAPTTPADCWVHTEIDALTPAYVLTRESAKSPLMQLVLRRYNLLPPVTQLKQRMSNGHISGEANVTADLPSRGRFAEMAAFFGHAGLTLRRVPCPSAVDSLLAELVMLLDEIDGRHSTSLGTHNLGMYGPSIAHDMAANIVSCGVTAPAITSSEAQPVVVAAVPSSAPSLAVPGLTHVRPPVVSDHRQPSYSPSLELSAPCIRVAEPLASPATGASHPTFAAHDAAVVTRLLGDQSPFALRPDDPDAVRRLCSGVFDTSWDNAGSRRKLDSNMRLWRRYTDSLNTPCWRPDSRGLSDLERERESVLAAGFIPFALKVMLGRRGPRAKPASAYKAYLGVRKAHGLRGAEMVSTKLVWRMVQRQNRKYLADFGSMSLIVKRKQPFTTAIMHALLAATAYTSAVKLSQPGPRAAFRAFTSTLRQTGMRKSELSLQYGETFGPQHASRAHLSWCLHGTIYATPPPDLLRSPRPGDYAILVPPPSKCDTG